MESAVFAFVETAICVSRMFGRVSLGFSCPGNWKWFCYMFLENCTVHVLKFRCITILRVSCSHCGTHLDFFDNPFPKIIRRAERPFRTKLVILVKLISVSRDSNQMNLNVSDLSFRIWGLLSWRILPFSKLCDDGTESCMKTNLVQVHTNR
uniref:Secreted protein n=1 Tax=Heterorhabditis bacteriophora TaxID=37862 RepID=A0A1I7XMT8_HETBA